MVGTFLSGIRLQQMSQGFRLVEHHVSICHLDVGVEQLNLNRLQA